MTERAGEPMVEGLVPDLDDLLQCPVCYEIPTGQIFQCNEGHHVCGRCKLRLDVCPVCRAFFFGTRNYAMEELIANVKRLQAFKLVGKVTGSTTPDQTVEVRENTSEENISTVYEDEDDTSSRTSVDPPRPCSGLFRCLCCKTNPERLPSARLLNHLRYFHSPELIEGRSENGEYLQAWQFATNPGRIAAAVRIADMGLFFLIIEISNDSVYAWLVMAASPRVAEDFSYTFTLSGNDREAIFSDCVWSVRTCEGFLKKRQRCLAVTGGDARSLLAPAAMSAKLSLRRTPSELMPHQMQPRAVLRVANRSNTRDADDPAVVASQDLEPFLQELQNDVNRLSRAFARFDRESITLVRSEAEIRARLDNGQSRGGVAGERAPPAAPAPEAPAPAAAPRPPPELPLDNVIDMSRNQRRRMRQRMREAFRETQSGNSTAAPPPSRPLVTSEATTRAPDQLAAGTRAPNATDNTARPSTAQNNNRVQSEQTNTVRANTANPPRLQNQGDRANNNQPSNTLRASNNPPRGPPQFNPAHTAFSGFAIVVEPPVEPPLVLPPVSGNSSGNGNNNGRNKKKRRQRT